MACPSIVVPVVAAAGSLLACDDIAHLYLARGALPREEGIASIITY
jgi:hypothetical protein